MSSIEWTDETWNPTVGCSRVSPGCDHCYAIKVAARQMQPAHEGLTQMRTRLDWTGEVRLLPDRLDTPLHWRKPRRVFVDSMSDLFHPDVPEEFIDSVFSTMLQAEQHTFQVLTKRPQRMAQLLGAAAPFYLPNVWLGTSVENQRYADLRIPYLLATPAAVRFLSIEPLLGPVKLDLDWLGYGAGDGIDWVIVGGESGPGARPMHPQWVRDLRDQCTSAEVPFFFKQWGEWAPGGPDLRALGIDGSWCPTRRENLCTITDPLHDHAFMSRTGKKAAGRELGGRTWNDYPAVGATA